MEHVIYIYHGPRLRKGAATTYEFLDRKPRPPGPLDPIHAIHKHFIKNKLNINHSIAAYRDDHNNIVSLTRSKFLRRINNILRATKKGYPRILGHCLIGRTTFYLVSGVPLDMVKKFGHWRSQAFLEYWRCLDYLGAIHIEMLPLKPRTRLVLESPVKSGFSALNGFNRNRNRLN
jgi:hypothetical protein